MSVKYPFHGRKGSLKLLRQRLETEDIDYVHYKALGSPREIRHKLRKDWDYNSSTKYVETVCCAGVDLSANQWLRLYPIPFRKRKFYEGNITILPVEEALAKFSDIL